MNANDSQVTHHATRTFHPPRASVGFRRTLGVVLAVLCIAPVTVAVIPALSPTIIDIDLRADGLHLKGGPGLFASTRDIALDQIRSVRPHQAGGGGRKMGTCMEGHCSGWWVYRDLGEVWQATDCRADVLLVETDAGRLLLSAEDMGGLRTALEKRTPFHAREEVFAPRWLRLLISVVGLGALVAAIWVLAISFFGAERLSYTVGPDGLTVRNMGRERHIDLRGATVKRVTGRVGLRVAGVGMPGYYTGLYWLEGGTVRLWATRAQDGILIESGGRFLVTPEHADDFLAAVQAVGAQVQA